MKSLYFLRLFLFYTLFFLSTSSIAQKITGTIKNGKGDSVIYFNYSSRYRYEKDSTPVTDNKRFIKIFSFAKPKTIVIIYGAFKKEVYVFPKANLQINFDAANDSLFQNTFSVTGDYYINQYLSTYHSGLHISYVYNRMSMQNPIDSLTSVLHNYRIFSDSLRNTFFKQTHQSRSIKAIDDFFICDSINWYSNSLLSAMDFLHFTQSGNRALFWKKEVKNRMPLSFSELYLNSLFYNRIWYFYFRNVREQALESADSIRAISTSVGSYALDYIRSNQIQNKLKEVIAKQVINDILSNYSDLSIEKANPEDSSVAVLLSIISDKSFLDNFTKEYRAKQKIVHSRRLGTKAPEFSLRDTSNKVVSLQNFKGKVVLIDVWASWCGPCIAEMPYMKALEQKLKEKKHFELLSVSVDNSKQAWIEKGIAKVNPPGLLLWQGDNESFSKAYNIQTIPQLILIDANGKYIDFNPPRASDGDKLYQLISEHLKE